MKDISRSGWVLGSMGAVLAVVVVVAIVLATPAFAFAAGQTGQGHLSLQAGLHLLDQSRMPSGHSAFMASAACT